jgi:hypothetical protein
MAYSTNLLSTAAECDAALTIAEDELKVLRHQESNIDYQRDNTTDSATETQAELAGLDADIASLNAQIPTITVVSTRKKRETELRKAVYRRAQLADLQEKRGIVALLKREMALAQVRVQIIELNTLVTAITTRKAEL